MRWFRAEEPTHEQSMTLFGEVDRAIDSLNGAGLEATPGAVQDVLIAKGTPVEIQHNDEGMYIVRTVKK